MKSKFWDKHWPDFVIPGFIFGPGLMVIGPTFGVLWASQLGALITGVSGVIVAKAVVRIRKNLDEIANDIVDLHDPKN